MAVEVAKITAKLEADIRDFERGMKKATKRIDKLEGSTGKATGKLGGLAAAGKKLLPIAAAGFGLAKGIAFMKSAVGAASDLEESINAVQVQFEEGADVILAFGQVAAQQVGLSNSAFNQLSVTTGALLSGFITDTRLAAEETINLTKRAADMASVFNVSVEEALSAVQASLRGEQEPIRRFGVLMDEASVAGKALQLGLADTTKELTAQDKAMARLQLIYEQTDKTAGDFLNTQESIANQERTLAARTEDLKASLGKGLAPAYNVALTFADRFATALSKGIALFDDTVAAAMRLNTVISFVNKDIGRGALPLDTLTVAFKRLVDDQNAYRANLDLVRIAVGANADTHIRALGNVLEYTRGIEDSEERQRILSETLFDSIRALELTDEATSALVDKYNLGAIAAEVMADEARNLGREQRIAADNAQLAAISSDDLNEAYRNSAFNAAKAALATDKLARSYGSAADFVRDLTRAQQESISPVASLLRADARLVAANETLNDLENDRKASTADVAEAMLSLVEAQADVIGARGQVLSATGENIEAFRRMAEQAGLAREQIDLMIASLTGIPATVGTTITVGQRRFNVGNAIGGNIALASGGITNGPVNANIGEGGVRELVTPLDGRGVGILEEAFRRAGTGGGDTFVTVEQSITVADDATAARRILEETRTQLDSLATERF